MKLRPSFWHLLVCLMALTLGSASSDCDDDRGSDRNPPAGQGSIVVDNLTRNNIRVFVNGENVGVAKDDRKTGFDFNPGVYRVILDEAGGDQTFRDDIDVLEGRVTVLEVAIGSPTRFDVFVFFD